MEQSSDLGVDVLNRLLFPLVRLQDFKELLIDLRLILKTVLGGVRQWRVHHRRGNRREMGGLETPRHPDDKSNNN